MGLQAKIINLKLEAALALRHANGWQKLIDLYGEARATEFYKHLGLNHLESKSIEWDGLTLSREPKEHEKLAVKGIAQAQESGKEAIGAILLNLRKQLISNGLASIGEFSLSNYHKLILDVPLESRSDLRDRLIQVHMQGRGLVVAEFVNAKQCDHDWSFHKPFRGYKCSLSHLINKFRASKRDNSIYLITREMFGVEQANHLAKSFNWEVSEDLLSIAPDTKAVDDDDFDELDDLTDLTTSRIANDVQSRITAAASRFSLLGQSGPTLINSVTNEVTGGSVAYIDRAATGLANKVINLGREDEAENRRDEWGRVEYSALLDQNVCGPCASEDGQSATNEGDLTPAPNPECEGGDWCRCFHVYVQS